MEPVVLHYKGLTNNHSMNVVAGYEGVGGSIFLIREGLNNSVYRLNNPDDLDLYYGVECSLKLTKKTLEVSCGSSFKFKGQSFRKLTRIELVELFRDKIYNPIKVDK